MRGRHIDGYPDALGPLRRVQAGGAQHPFAQRRDQAGILGDGNEHGGRNRAAGGMVPAQQRFIAGDLLRARRHHRLVDEVQPVAGQRTAQILLQLPAILGIGMHFGRIEAMHAAPVALGGIQRQIRVANQRVGGDAIARADGHADRHADHHRRPFDHIGFGNGRDDRARQQLQARLVMIARQQHLELVAALPPDQPLVADHPLQSLADLAQQRVARRVA